MQSPGRPWFPRLDRDLTYWIVVILGLVAVGIALDALWGSV